MHMWYWCGVTIENFIFEGYNITNGWGLYATCMMLATLAVFFEFIKVLQARLRQRELRRRQANLRAICTNENVALIGTSSDVPGRLEHLTFNKYYIFFHELMLWLFQECLGYGLMLSVMFYNAYMTLAVAVGAGLGYFLFGQTLIKINKENCVVKKESLCYNNCRENDSSGLIQNAETQQENSISEAQTSTEEPESGPHVVMIHAAS